MTLQQQFKTLKCLNKLFFAPLAMATLSAPILRTCLPPRSTAMGPPLPPHLLTGGCWEGAEGEEEEGEWGRWWSLRSIRDR